MSFYGESPVEVYGSTRVCCGTWHKEHYVQRVPGVNLVYLVDLHLGTHVSASVSTAMYLQASSSGPECLSLQGGN